jgi:hypothetical protein
VSISRCLVRKARGISRDSLTPAARDAAPDVGDFVSENLVLGG